MSWTRSIFPASTGCSPSISSRCSSPASRTGGVANAINIIDGFNGLAAGALLIYVRRFRMGGGSRSAVCWSSAGAALRRACARVLRGELSDGQDLLGDGGALFLRTSCSPRSACCCRRATRKSRLWAAILICAYPVIETLASVRRKSRRTTTASASPIACISTCWPTAAMPTTDRASRSRAPAQSGEQPRPGCCGHDYGSSWHSAMTTPCSVRSSSSAPAYICGQIYRVMSLNAPNLPLGLADCSEPCAAPLSTTFRECNFPRAGAFHTRGPRACAPLRRCTHSHAFG